MKRKIPIAAILQISVGIALLVVTIVFFVFGMIERKNEIIFAVLIALSGLGEGIIGFIEYKKK